MYFLNLDTLVAGYTEFYDIHFFVKSADAIQTWSLRNIFAKVILFN